MEKILDQQTQNDSNQYVFYLLTNEPIFYFS